ncbi:MAG TPA: class E sortase [Gaiellaceae bacterium]|nr:class E sortase [Gaiellaceae bacterium]
MLRLRIGIPAAGLAVGVALGVATHGARSAALRAAPRIPLGQPIGRLLIPRLGESLVFRQGVADSVLQYGPGHYPQTSLPGKPGTVAIAGHRVTHTRPFLRLNLLHRNDLVTLVVSGKRFRYRIYAMRIVTPTSLWVLMRHSRAQRLVLTTCHPPHRATFRLVAFARRVA